MRRSPLILLLAIVILAFQPATVLTQVAGEWSAVMGWPYRAIHAALLPTGKVLFWELGRKSRQPSALGLGHKRDQRCHQSRL